jgi:hypothetical protein
MTGFAKQSILATSEAWIASSLALLAMTRQASTFPPHHLARVLPDTTLKKMRGRRECRMLAAPMARLQQKEQAAVTTGSAETTGGLKRCRNTPKLERAPANSLFTRLHRWLGRALLWAVSSAEIGEAIE